LRNDKKLLKNENHCVSILAVRHAFTVFKEEKQMKYDDVILRWAKIATVLFTAMAVVADIFGVVIVKYIAYVWAGVFDLPRVIALTVIFYIGTIGGYLVLIPLFKMLSNMSKDKVFDRENTKIMTIITCALVGIAVDCTVCGFIWNGGWILAIVALFMSLVVLSIRVVFSKAITMKEEMDLTI
jgi:hypothetical protein